MMAEQLMDAIVQATGVREPFTGWAPIQRAMAIPHGSPGDLLPIFGKVADREFIRERESDPNITQVLHLNNGDSLQGKLVSAEGNFARWRDELKGRDAELVDRVFLAILTRRPTAEERQAILSEFARSPLERESVTQDTAWALLNSKEFLYIHYEVAVTPDLFDRRSVL